MLLYATIAHQLAYQPRYNHRPTAPHNATITITITIAATIVATITSSSRLHLSDSFDAFFDALHIPLLSPQHQR
jgi:hypothetical protein